MGCKIHCRVEHRNIETGEWELIEGRWGYYKWSEDDSGKYACNIWDDSNYEMFGYLAQVRNSGYDERSEPRGYPDDCSKEVAADLADGDMHSHSYFTLTELLNWSLWWDKKARLNARWFYKSVIGQLMLLDEDWDNTRLLFCFDN